MPDDPYGQYPGFAGGEWGGGQPNPYPYEAPLPGTSGFAIAAFVLGLLGLVLFSVIFGIVALVRMRRQPQKGKGLAVAGLVLSGVWLVLFVIVIVAVVNTVHNRPVSPNGSSSPSGGLSVFSLSTGDCFDNPGDVSSIHSVAAVPCTSPHNAQVFGQFKLSGTLYPGNASVQHAASKDCNGQVMSRLDQSKINNSMGIRYIFPLEESWYLGQRAISCIIVNPTATLKSSVLNS